MHGMRHRVGAAGPLGEMMFEPTDKITVELTVAEWNQIVALLNLAAGTVPVLVGRVQQQAAAQEAAKDEERRPPHLVG